MRICIHRGTKEIGGTCIEVESQGKRIVLDVGLPLDAVAPNDSALPPVKGFDAPDESLLGVVISHPHQDHYGLARRLPKETLFLIGKAAESILAAAELFSPAGLTLARTRHMENRKPLEIGPFVITPYLMDHSAYDAYAVLIEADGARLFYTGDLRGHGRKASLFQRLLKSPPEHVDVLLMEGTTVGGSSHGFSSEQDVEQRFVELFQQTQGMPLVCCSSQNIDRVVSMVRACIRTQRQCILDMYTAHVLQATANERIPQADWGCVRVFLPFSQKRRIVEQQAFNVSNLYRCARIYPEQLAIAAPHSVMLFRPSMRRDLEEAACLNNSRIIYSLWPGYLKDPTSKSFLEWVERYKIPLDHCHTSGHASVDDLIALRRVFRSAPVVPIHSAEPHRFQALFENVQQRADGEWYDVATAGESGCTREGR